MRVGVALIAAAVFLAVASVAVARPKKKRRKRQMAKHAVVVRKELHAS